MAAGGSAPRQLWAGEDAGWREGRARDGRGSPAESRARPAGRAPRALPRVTLHGGLRALTRPPLPSQPARPTLSHSSHPLTPTPCAEPGPASPVTRRGRAESKMATPPPPPPHSAGSGRPLTRRARARGPAKNSQARLYLVRPDPGAAARTPPRPAPPRPSPPGRCAEWRRGGGDRGEPTPLSAARAGGGAGPTAEFSNIACVNHAPRVRQCCAAPGPAPPTTRQSLNGCNVAAPSFLPRLDWNLWQCRDSVPVL